MEEYTPSLNPLIATQFALTALASLFNAAYFSAYRCREKRHRLAALVLLVVNLAFLAQSLYLLLAGRPGGFWPGLPWLLSGFFSFIAAVLMSLLILRRWLREGKP